MENNAVKYPCTWNYKIIGLQKEDLYLVALEIIPKPFTHTLGKESSGGKYKSLEIAINVENKQERDSIFQALQQDSRICFVL